jgi:alkylhydroperoxidase family enzyme
MIHDTRIIPTDGRPHVSPSIRGYFGDSTGRWEGDTLVVDVTNFSASTNYRGSRDTLHLVERFRRVDDGLRYEVTVDDPSTWTAPWTAALDLEVQPEGMFEYACHEGNHAMRNILSAARAAERSTVETSAGGRLPIEHIQLRGDRFRGLHYREITPAQRLMLEHTVNSARAVTNTTANGPFNVLLRSPEIGDLSQQLGNAIRFSSGLSGRLRELATLMAGRAWTSHYEWYAHARYAVEEGIPAAVIEAIAAHRTPDLAAMPVEDAMVWRVSDELLYTRRVTDSTFAEALAVLGERRLVSVATLAAYYEYISMILNVDRYPLPPDAPAAAMQAVAPLPLDVLYRKPIGAVTPRPPIANTDTERALEALRSGVSEDAELPRDVREAALAAVTRQWNRTPTAAAGVNGIAYELATELLDTREVSDATFATAIEAFGERRLVNLLVLMGHSNIRCAQLALAGSPCALAEPGAR